jgi:hypothetical protein
MVCLINADQSPGQIAIVINASFYWIRPDQKINSLRIAQSLSLPVLLIAKFD